MAADSCNIYNNSGGGVSFIKPNTDWLDSSKSATFDYGNWSLTGGVQFSGAGVIDNTGSGTGDCVGCDLTLILASLTQEICTQINTELGISGIPTYGDSIETGSAVSGIHFSGGYESFDTININGETMGCFEELADDQRYVFFQVLIAR